MLQITCLILNARPKSIAMRKNCLCVITASDVNTLLCLVRSLSYFSFSQSGHRYTSIFMVSASCRGLCYSSSYFEADNALGNFRRWNCIFLLKCWILNLAQILYLLTWQLTNAQLPLPSLFALPDPLCSLCRLKEKDGKITDLESEVQRLNQQIDNQRHKNNVRLCCYNCHRMNACCCLVKEFDLCCRFEF